MTDEELIARLRNTPNWMREGFQNWKDNVRTYDTAPFEAADRIEALLNLNEALVELMDDRDAKLAEFRHALLWCGGSADFNEGGVAREGWLKVCAPLLKGDTP